MPPDKFDDPAPSRFPAVIAILAITSLLFLIGLNYFWSRLDMTVTEPKLVVTLLPTGQRIQQIEGSFRLDRHLNGIPSKGIGGACLIGDFADRLTVADATTKGVVTSPCTDRWDCNPHLPRGSNDKPGPTHRQKWEGYCINDQSVMGKCWYKPWDDPNDGLLCNTSGMNPGGTPWQVGIDYPTPKGNGFSVRDFYNRYTRGQPVRWRVSGRLSSTTDPKTPRFVFGKPECLIPAGNNKKC